MGEEACMITEQRAREICPIYHTFTSNQREYVRARGYRRLYFAHNNAGEPVIWAHTPNCRPYGHSQQLPWPVSGAFRSYYKTNDFIMLGVVRRPQLVEVFPSLRQRYQHDSVDTYLNILDCVLFGSIPSLPEYKIARRIKSITPSTDGEGEAVRAG